MVFIFKMFLYSLNCYRNCVWCDLNCTTYFLQRFHWTINGRLACWQIWFRFVCVIHRCHMCFYRMYIFTSCLYCLLPYVYLQILFILSLTVCISSHIVFIVFYNMYIFTSCLYCLLPNVYLHILFILSFTICISSDIVYIVFYHLYISDIVYIVFYRMYIFWYYLLCLSRDHPVLLCFYKPTVINI